METNEVIDKLPRHLMNLVIDQPYNEYTMQDHAVWRYVMRQNVNYLSGVAHKSYLNGLKKTGVSIDFIPHMYGMNRILKDIGWAAVAVDGFIPPSAFMEFQAYNVLVIAADIRPFDQIEYTPAPDIIHEAAGHAPIIADPEYAAYLRFFGEIGSKAFSSADDYNLYEAIRHISILKADPYTTQKKIEEAEAHLLFLEKTMGNPSEMALIRNLHWWTVEYGLIGELDRPKIYGAGLLSSIGESYTALNNGVKKLPYTIDAINYNFDITTKQPQLFITPDFEQLNAVLNQFADTMALRTGGLKGIKKAIDSKHTATIVYSSGLQLSGTFSNVIEWNGSPAYISTNSPTSLCFQGKELTGHHKDYHANGFGAPVGKIKNTTKPLEDFTNHDLHNFGLKGNEKVILEFESGVIVEGKVKDFTRKEDKLILISFYDCSVKYKQQVLFEPDWGIYDMAVGESIISAYSGPADPDAFGLTFPVPKEKTHKIVHDSKAKKLHENYKKVRNFREKGFQYEALKGFWESIKTEYPEDWLLPMEILEIVTKQNVNDGFRAELTDYIKGLKKSHPEFKNLINNGFEILSKNI
ncbi:aromatic amino acid hydroxylase [candidate division KSB1 bacterium]